MQPTNGKRQKARVKQDVGQIIDVLETVYGRPRFVRRFDPMEELVSCILSQHTADANSFPAFTRLRERFPDWQEVVDAGWEEVAFVVKKAGLANQKGRSIVASLKSIHDAFGAYTLDPLAEMEVADARKFLLTLPGVGPKTAAIVLCFGFGLPAIPVDTHVHRVSLRLGLIPEKTSADQAHDLLLELVPPDLAFRFHVALIQHGRLTCKAQRPECERCAIAFLCPSAGTFGSSVKKGRTKTPRG